MRYKCLTGLLFFLAGLSAGAHPLHLSFTRLEYRKARGNWEMTVRVFSDDLKENIRQSAGADLDAIPVDDREARDSVLTAWVARNLSVAVDGTEYGSRMWQLEKTSYRDDATWLTFSIKAPYPAYSLKIRNELLLDLFRDQKNLFVVKLSGKDKSWEFENKVREHEFILNKKERNL